MTSTTPRVFRSATGDLQRPETSVRLRGDHTDAPGAYSTRRMRRDNADATVEAPDSTNPGGSSDADEGTRRKANAHVQAARFEVAARSHQYTSKSPGASAAAAATLEDQVTREHSDAILRRLQSSNTKFAKETLRRVHDEQRQRAFGEAPDTVPPSSTRTGPGSGGSPSPSRSSQSDAPVRAVDDARLAQIVGTRTPTQASVPRGRYSEGLLSSTLDDDHATAKEAMEGAALRDRRARPSAPPPTRYFGGGSRGVAAPPTEGGGTSSRDRQRMMRAQGRNLDDEVQEEQKRRFREMRQVARTIERSRG